MNNQNDYESDDPETLETNDSKTDETTLNVDKSIHRASNKEYVLHNQASHVTYKSLHVKQILMVNFV